MLDSVLQKAGMGVDPHFIDVWVPIHRDEFPALFVLSMFSSLLCRIDTQRS
jgi:hypothetical protein